MDTLTLKANAFSQQKEQVQQKQHKTRQLQKKRITKYSNTNVLKHHGRVVQGDEKHPSNAKMCIMQSLVNVLRMQFALYKLEM